MAHTTRAYMSEVAEDNPYAYDARMRAVDGYKVDYQNAAMSEASRILADVDSGTPYSAIHLGGNCIGFAEAGQVALAESLAAFVNDGGRA